MSIGKKVWIFPDGDIPQPGDREPHGHESLVIMNPASEDAVVKMTVYFSDREPVRDIIINVGAERVRCVRTNEVVGDAAHTFQIPFGQYALKLESNVPVVAQIGRMDVTQPNLTYYTVMGYGQ